MKPRLFLSLSALSLSIGCGTVPVFRGAPLAALEDPTALDSDERIDEDGSVDRALLGAVLDHPYDPSLPLDVQTRVNPCSDELLVLERETPDRAPSLGVSVREDHVLHYRFNLRGRLLAIPTEEYATCCESADCGRGMINGLSLGEGRLSRGRGTRPGGRSDLALRLAGEPLELEIASEDRVRGALAFSLDASVGTSPASPEREWPAHLDARRIRVETLDARGSYRFCDGSACMSENEFVRRYRDLSGSAELDEYERDWAADARGAGGVLLALGLLTSGTGIGVAQIEPDPDLEKRSEQDRATGVVLGMGLLTTAIGTALVAAPYDGFPEDHCLSIDDGRRFAARYNRALRGQASPL